MTITAEDYPVEGERWRHVHTDEVVTITHVGNLGMTWYRHDSGSPGQSPHRAFLPGREQVWERV
jgi:hypothetical protein